MRTFLGLDLGTSATKGVILASDGRVIARARARHPDSRRGGVGRADPSAWEESILAVCRQLAPQLAEVSGVGLDTHCPTIVPMGDDGHPVTFAVTWDNPALTTYFDHYSPLRSTKAIRSTGNHPSRSTFAAIAYHYLREAEPDAFARMTTLGFAGTWLGQQLTGEAAIDPTQASYTGVYNTIGRHTDWLPKTLTELGIEPSVLPPVRPAMDVLGHAGTDFAELAGIPRGVPVIVGCADTPAASYALGTAPGTNPFLIMGTTHVVNSCLSAPDLRARALQRRGLRPDRFAAVVLVTSITVSTPSRTASKPAPVDRSTPVDRASTTGRHPRSLAMPTNSRPTSPVPPATARRRSLLVMSILSISCNRSKDTAVSPNVTRAPRGRPRRTAWRSGRTPLSWRCRPR